MSGKAKAKQFLEGKSEGYCLKCGTRAEAYDTDEGTTENHFFARMYYCEKCEDRFIEEYSLIPQSIYLWDGDVGYSNE